MLELNIDITVTISPGVTSQSTNSRTPYLHDNNSNFIA